MLLSAVKNTILNKAPFTQSPLDDEEEGYVMELFNAAMWVAQGYQTQLSRSGFSVVFKAEYRRDRADLSGIPSQAFFQLQKAKIDVDAVTEQQLEDYRAWRFEQDHQKNINHARIIITRPFCEPYRGSTGSCGNFVRVSLKDGFNTVIDHERIECKMVFEPETINKGGFKGAYCAHPDYEKIKKRIAFMQQDFPEYAGAVIFDNNLRSK